MRLPENDALVRATGLIHACAAVDETDRAAIDEHVKTTVAFLKSLDREDLIFLTYGLAAVAGRLTKGLAGLLEKYGGYSPEEFIDSIVQEAMRVTDD